MMFINKIMCLGVYLLSYLLGITLKAQPVGVVMDKYDSILYEGVLSSKIDVKSGFYKVTTNNGVIVMKKNWFYIKPEKEGVCNIFLQRKKSIDTIALVVKKIPNPIVFVVPRGENGGRSIKTGIALTAQCQNCEIDLRYTVLGFTVKFTTQNDSGFAYHNAGSLFSKKIRNFFKNNLTQFRKIEFVDIELMLPTKKRVFSKEIVQANINDSPW
jgi:GldM C-terminal domain